MELVEKLIASKVFSVVVTGGEPLVRKGLTKKIIRRLKQEDIDTSLNTNLLLLDRVSLEDLLACKLDGMLVSCTTSDSELYDLMTRGGNYHQFETKVKMLVTLGQHFAVNMVVNRHNIGHIRKTATRMRDIGVKVFGATPMGLNATNPDLENLLEVDQVKLLVEDLIWAQEHLNLKTDIFEALPKCVFPAWVRSRDYAFLNRKCQAGKTIASIANNGDVRACSHNPDVYGNLFNESIESIWSKMGAWRDQRTAPGRCLGCKLVGSCYGGCRITARTFTGDHQGEDPWMDKPLSVNDMPQRKVNGLSLGLDTTLTFADKLHWRQETEEDYLMSSTRGNRNITMVNRPLLEFAQELRRLSPISLEHLARVAGCNPGDAEFQRVLTLLVTRGFVYPQQPGRKEERYVSTI